MTQRRLLKIEEVAERLDRPVATLYDWRLRQVGPPSAKLMGRVVYDEKELEAWIDEQFAAAAEGR